MNELTKSGPLSLATQKCPWASLSPSPAPLGLVTETAMSGDAARTSPSQGSPWHSWSVRGAANRLTGRPMGRGQKAAALTHVKLYVWSARGRLAAAPRDQADRSGTGQSPCLPSCFPWASGQLSGKTEMKDDCHQHRHRIGTGIETVSATL